MQTTPEDVDSVPPGFDPALFWVENRNKILIYAVLLLAGLAAYGAFQISNQRNIAAAQALFSQATKPEDYRQVIQKFPRTTTAANAQLLLAAQLRDEKKYDEAETVLRDFISQYPDHMLAGGGQLSLAATLEEQGKTDEAIEAYQQVVLKYANTYAAPLAILSQANLLRGKGKLDEAKRAYETVISQYPDSLCAQQAMQVVRMLHK
jgi:tol-pal system protein YbgF